MKVSMDKLVIHHFLSMGHCEIDLSNRGYCLVSGVNNSPADAAKSNGSGKSTIWNALSYALTGKTVQGTTGNLPNNHFDDGCWVSLTLNVNGHDYSITRSKDDKDLGTNLKIIVDGKDMSGKGIKESQAVLEGMLPDLNEELIGSIIILGQGLPNRFTSNTPSKRKEILEHLSKSDFMIDDLKRRVNARIESLGRDMREVEDGSLRDTTLKFTYSQQLAGARAELEALDRSVAGNLDEEVGKLETSLRSLEEDISRLGTSISTASAEAETATGDVLKVTGERQDAIDKVRKMHEGYAREDSDRKSRLNGDIYILRKDIARMKSITDICPTCGQRLPNVTKPDTSAKEAELAGLEGQLAELDRSIEEDSREFQDTLAGIDRDFNSRIAEMQARATSLRDGLARLNRELSEDNSRRVSLTQELASVKARRDTYTGNRKRIEASIADLTSRIESLDKSLGELSTRAGNIGLHQEVVNKMNTYIKRDFRGFLLSNVIDYIQMRAREYSSKIFDTDDIVFALEGNNINISLCGKAFENLSGGERQRVDLIIQFAIRDMMCQYLDFSCNILVLDEVTDNLDSMSCDRVLNFITSELRDIESVFIISHHSQELDIAVDGEIVVEKDADGVSGVTSQY